VHVPSVQRDRPDELVMHVSPSAAQSRRKLNGRVLPGALQPTSVLPSQLSLGIGQLEGAYVVCSQLAAATQSASAAAMHAMSLPET
jgi:hypothetical protein